MFCIITFWVLFFFFFFFGTGTGVKNLCYTRHTQEHTSRRSLPLSLASEMASLRFRRSTMRMLPTEGRSEIVRLESDISPAMFAGSGRSLAC